MASSNRKPRIGDDIRFGFEVECVISGEKWESFVKRIIKLEQSADCRIQISDDGSIRRELEGRPASYYMSVELKISPLLTTPSMKLLKRVFAIVRRYGGTNETCGLHVNVSSSNRKKMCNFDPIKFAQNSLWNDILRTFQRTANSYCKSTVIDKPASKMQFYKSLSNSFLDRYSNINYTNFPGDTINDRTRVEIRGLGNKNYEQKYDVIAPIVRQIKKVFNTACD